MRRDCKAGMGGRLWEIGAGRVGCRGGVGAWEGGGEKALADLEHLCQHNA